MINRNTKQNIAVLSTATLILVANFWHVISEWTKNNHGTFFTGISHYYQDYFLYVSYIVQGARGNWPFVSNLYTNEPMSPFWYYWMYAGIGKILSFTHIPAPHLYNIFLFAMSIWLLYLLYRVALTLFHNQYTALTAFLMLITASNFASDRLIGFTWFSPTPALNRIGGVPHQTLQTVLILALFLQINNINKISTAGIISIALMSFISALISPIHTMILVCASGLALLFRLYWSKQLNLQSIFHSEGARLMLVLFIPTGIGVLAATQGINSMEIYAIARSWELAQDVPISPREWLISLGPIATLLPFGVRAYFTRIGPLRLQIALYAIIMTALFFSPIPGILNIARVRWLHPSGYILFPLIATEGFITILSWLRRKRVPINTAATVLLFSYFLLTVPAILIQIRERTAPFYMNSPVTQLNHIPFPVIDAFRFLYDNARTNEVILTDSNLPYDSALPAFTGAYSYSGHILHTLYSVPKNELRTKFFLGDMVTEEAQKFLSDHRIGYILIAPGSQEILKYPFLKETLRNDTVALYTVLY